MKHLFLTLICGLVLFASCTYDKHFPTKSTGTDTLPPYVCTDTVHFSTDLQPIIANTCELPSCHAGHGGNGPAALDYTQFSNIQLEDSAIYTRIKMDPSNTNVGGFMPKAGTPLPDSIIQKFYCWWKQGGLNN